MIENFAVYTSAEVGTALNNTQWRIHSALDRVLAREILDGIVPKAPVSTAAGVRTISTAQQAEQTDRIPITTSFQNIAHSLGRKPTGWIVVSPDADARIWEDAAANNPDPTKFIRVKASAAVNCKFWVF